MFHVAQYPTEKTQNWLVRQFEFFQFDGSSLVEMYVPRPDISLIFHFDNTPLVLNDSKIFLNHFFGTPIITQSLVLKLFGKMNTFVVICKPTVLSRILDLNLSSIPKQSIDLPYDLFNPLWNNLSKIESISERINFFTVFINSFQQTVYCPDIIDLLYDRIIEKSITTPLCNIIKECPASGRTLQRSFKKRTGVSPKTLARIVRIDYLWAKIKEENAIDYQNLVFDGHYFDQAHFINDFKSIIGEPPSYFFNRNQNILKLISGRKSGQY
jgi:AraC-like DNA-binding protein